MKINHKRTKGIKMKTFEFEVPCSYHYTIKANTEKEAREILIKKGGLDIDGELCLDEDNYKQAKLI
tara:strand:+ start:64 stop:261 length:198 start_codon:yes stop_codon:yes gene_type:complete